MSMAENDEGRRFFTTSEVAKYCAVTNDGVLKWIKSGKLRAFSTPGGHYRVSSEDFREFLEQGVGAEGRESLLFDALDGGQKALEIVLLLRHRVSAKE